MGCMKDTLGDQPYADLFTQRPVMDAAGSRAEREAGTSKIESANSEWLKDYLEFVARLPAEWTGTGEDIRAVAPVRAPTHPNAWGAATQAAIRVGLIEKTGRHLPMKDKSSHARETPEYRRSPHD